MKFKQLALVDFEKDSLPEAFISRLNESAEEIIFVNETEKLRRNQALKNSDALLVRYFTHLSAEDIDVMPNLKYIGASSASVDQVDVSYAERKGIVVKNIAGYSNNSIAEFVFGALLGHIRHLPEALKKVGEDDFTVYPSYQGWELQNKTFGILGLGSIGKRVSEVAMGLGMKVQYYSRNRKPDYEQKGVNYVDRQALFETSDVIGIFIEFNDETKGSIQNSDLDLISKNKVLISIAHTHVFDVPALVEVLKNKSFTFIQTYFSTIPDEHRDQLKVLPNVILYPSIAVQTKETKQRMQQMMICNLEGFLRED